MTKLTMTLALMATVATSALAQTNTNTTATALLVQNLNFRLTAYNQSSSSAVQVVRITTKDIIKAFAGSPVSKGQLQLVSTVDNPPGTTGNLGAYLRVVSGSTVVTTIPSPDSFNLFQDAAIIQTHGAHTVSHSLNRFSIDFAAFHAELQGYSTWNIVAKSQNGVDLGGSGAFTSNVDGVSTWDQVTMNSVPTQGTITATAPKPGS